MVGTGTSISGHTQASTTTLSSWAMRFRNRIAETTSSATKQDNSANEAWAQRRVLDPACSFSQRQHPPGWKDSDPQPPFPEPNNGGSRRFFRDTRHAHISLPTTAAKSGRERARERAAHHTRPTRPPGETAVLFTLKHAERSEEVHRDPSFCRLPTVKIYSCPLMPRGGACRMKKWVPPCQKACHAAQTRVCLQPRGLLLPPWTCTSEGKTLSPGTGHGQVLSICSGRNLSLPPAFAEHRGNALISSARGKMNTI